MKQFADEAVIEVSSGKGGNGCISFRREKYIPNGGPNGGDGGRGGDVVFSVRRNLRTLADLRYRHFFRAKNGGDGMGWNRTGRDGEDIVIHVPPGTAIRDAETNELIKEFTTESEDEQFVFLRGGNGGWGNVHFKSSTNQAPRRANPGQPGESRKLLLEMSIIADIGLVGFPNAGKSTLLDVFTNARPKIAPYPFTTKIPNLGVLRADDGRDVVIADIPGIIEGASEGRGLGIRFLKHISRTAGLLFMIDVSDPGFRGAYRTLCAELSGYSPELLEKPRIVLCNKTDREGAEENARLVAEDIRKTEEGTAVLPVSVATRAGLDDVRRAILKLMGDVDALASEAAAHPKPSDRTFLSLRSVDENDERGVQIPGSER